MNSKFEILTPQGFQGKGRPQKMRLNKKTSCTKCGICCYESSPSLMKEDIVLFISGILSHENTYVIRDGERIKRDFSIYESSLELIKIKGKEGTSVCLFYDESKGCSIYENRPFQCRVYKCWEPENLLSGLQERALTRSDIFASIDLIMEIIKRHEQMCSFRKLSDAIDRLTKGSEEALEDIIDILQYDTYIRPFLEEKFKIPTDLVELILGRPLTDAINEFGFKVLKDADEYILLPTEEVR